MAESHHRSWRAWRSRWKVMGLDSQPNPTPHQLFTPRSPASQAPSGEQDGLARWMARKRVFIRLRKWIGSLRPYPSLALFAVPVIVLEPVKPLAAYLIASGQMATGMTVLAIGEILKLVIVERLFRLCRGKLLKIPMFAWGYGHWRQGVNWIVSMRAWQAARRRI